jgi:2-C-methyl-D-erythritol 2,4-cyclodiphosphate synthase
MDMMRIGIGYDVHAFVVDRPLIMGGVTIPHTKGLLGHSDADVLTHAIMDALLGAVALGSIGDWFPDTDPQYKNANSTVLLKTVCKAVQKQGFRIGNVDTVIVAQEPVFKPHIQAIRESLAEAMAISVDTIGVKATTTEQLGFEGRSEGIAVHATALVAQYH